MRCTSAVRGTIPGRSHGGWSLASRTVAAVASRDLAGPSWIPSEARFGPGTTQDSGTADPADLPPPPPPYGESPNRGDASPTAPCSHEAPRLRTRRARRGPTARGAVAPL